MIIISGTRADDFDLIPMSLSDSGDTTSMRSYVIQNRALRSNSLQPSSPSSFSPQFPNNQSNYSTNSTTSTMSGSNSNTSKRNSSLSHLCYSQEFVENHLKSTAEMASQFEIRKVLLIGACRMFKDFLLNYKKGKSDDVTGFIRVKIEFIRTECKKLSLLAETIYITTPSHHRKMECCCNVISQMDIINEIVDNLTKIERDAECLHSTLKQGVSKSFRSNSLVSFSYDFQRASTALEAVDELPLEKGITLLLLRRNLERRTNRMLTNTLLDPISTKEDEQADKLYLQEEIGLLPKEFQTTLNRFYMAQRGGSFCSLTDLIPDDSFED
ncbi:hypothetical protein NAEGRDRAFT_81840 [Naegleria gruberi]|uniref:Uncharacterized protein n=1 Tax=Naegleria gruberi TaxID=5762 RepID=D2VZM1_NAEGR|nr:uncharacterized protein NAEGRDRAFT_81840 [Naegleria gruberi]EFC37683.1 hypothetical protein NAEGRDRAFT_81840 [Naegleria gruberi]|eukprot:XP_002670427.1 hypothetical protein NAEGRDRAFT_81840 [Naegleria gruberi strain NEG-M]